jgi:hypothetical protein
MLNARVNVVKTIITLFVVIYFHNYYITALSQRITSETVERSSRCRDVFCKFKTCSKVSKILKSIYRMCHFFISFKSVHRMCHFLISLKSVYRMCYFLISFKSIYRMCHFLISLKSIYGMCHFLISLKSIYRMCHFLISLKICL